MFIKMTIHRLKTPLRFLPAFFLLFLPSLYAAESHQGTIRGTVRDAQSNEPLAFTNVFLANTTLGDAANERGEYVLEDVPAGTYQLVVSRIGYKMLVTNVAVLPEKTTIQHAKLHIETIEGEEIAVVAQNMRDWRRDFKTFKRQFLGETDNAQKCKILNPKVLSFDREGIANSLRARADSILIVENYALGYRIEIILEEFQWSDYGGRYFAYPKYSELNAGSDRERDEWMQQRKSTFESSMRKFFTTLVTERFDSYQLLKFVDTPPGIPSRAVLIDDLAITVDDSSRGMYRLAYDGAMQVQNKNGNITNLFFNYGFIDFDERGNIYPPDGIKIRGYWGRHRIADSLPFDYWPPNK